MNPIDVSIYVLAINRVTELVKRALGQLLVVPEAWQNGLVFGVSLIAGMIAAALTDFNLVTAPEVPPTAGLLLTGIALGALANGSSWLFDLLTAFKTQLTIRAAAPAAGTPSPQG